MSAPLVQVEGLAKRYPSGGGILTVFEQVAFDLLPGQSVALVGESGAGKSTLLHLLGALDSPSEGSIRFDDRPLTGAADAELARFRNEQVGYVWQSYHLLPEFTALENVIMPLLIAGEKRVAVEPSGKQALERMGLTARETHQAGELSGGEQQRVAIARALVRSPRLVLADEPTGNLDHRTGGEIIAQLLDLPKNDGVALVMATHNLEYARRCDRVFRVSAGLLSEV